MRSAAAMADGVRAFLAALTQDLSERAKVDPGLVPFAQDLSEVRTDAVQRGPFERLDHPAMAHLEQALGLAKGRDAALGPALEAARTLDWLRTFAGGGIEESLAQGMLAAQAAGTYGCFASRTLAAGLFLLAPGIRYPLHTHAAAEIYYCIAGRLRIQHGLDGAPFELAAGGYSITPPNRLHALETGTEPALLIYVWRGDLGGPNWWWSRHEDGAWQRTAWLRKPGESWKPSRSEPVTEEVMLEAQG